MAKVVIYSKDHCPYCVRAKSLLKSKGVAFEEHNIENKPEEMKALMERTGLRTVPQIFIDDKLIGGFDDMNALDKDGKLDPLLK